MADSKTIELKMDVVNKRSTPPLSITGAFGGLSAQAMVIAHLYVEYPDVPTAAAVKFAMPSGAVLENSMVGRNGVHIREVVETLVLTPDVAEALGQWLKDQAAAARKAIAEQKVG